MTHRRAVLIIPEKAAPHAPAPCKALPGGVHKTPFIKSFFQEISLPVPLFPRPFSLLPAMTLAACMLLAPLCLSQAAWAGDNATELFVPFKPKDDPNRAAYAMGILFRANLADISPGEETQGMVRYPGPLRKLGVRAHAGQKIRIVGMDGGLRMELPNGDSVVGTKGEKGFDWRKVEK